VISMDRYVTSQWPTVGRAGALFGATLATLAPGRVAAEAPAPAASVSAPSSAEPAEPPVPVEQLCEPPGPKPAAPTCARYASSRVVRGGKVQVVQTPIASCINDPRWVEFDAWEASSKRMKACVNDYCAGQGVLHWSAAVCGPGLSPRIACSTTKVRPVDCSKAPPQMAVLPGGSDVPDTRGEKVSIAPLALDLTEVTVDAYAQCVSAGRCSEPDTGHSCNWKVGGRGKHPINCVDWSQATAYCQWAGKRLPTDPEWEWAALGQTRRTLYPWGNDAPGARACWDGEGNSLGRDNRRSTCEVGAFPSGDAPGGIHDLAGNVSEWTSTASSDGIRVHRGGSWISETPLALSAVFRGGFEPSSRNGFLGFRCAR
jgi:sulfatase modifying factor 1